MSKPIAIYITTAVLFVSNAAMVRADSTLMKKEAAETTKAFVTQLGGTMKKEMKAGGPLAAVKVCSELAPQITA